MSESTIVRMVWMLTGLALLVGVGGVWFPASQRIAAIRAVSRELYDEANQNETEAHRARELSRVRERVAADVRYLAGQSSGAAATAAAVHLLGEESRHFNVELRSI